MPSNQIRLFLAFVCVLVGGPTWGMPIAEPGELWASTPGGLLRPGGFVSQFEPHATIPDLRELEFRADGVLFATTAGPTPKLITIRLDTGAVTDVGPLPGRVHALEFVDDVLYGALETPPTAEGEFASSHLVTIDPNTAAVSVIGELGFHIVKGLAHDPVSERTFAVGRRLDQEPGCCFSVFFNVDLATGAGSEVAEVLNEAVSGLEFGLDGKLWGGLDSSAFEIGGLYTLNPETGQVLEFLSSNIPDFEGLAVVPRRQNAIEVPVAGPGGLLLLAIVLGAVGMGALRRRTVGFGGCPESPIRRADPELTLRRRLEASGPRRGRQRSPGGVAARPSIQGRTRPSRLRLPSSGGARHRPRRPSARLRLSR